MADDTDGHTMYVSTGKLTEDQVRTAIQHAIASARKNNPQLRLGDISLMINTTKHQDGRLTGLSYVRVSSTPAFNLLLGKNVDGTERKVLIKEESSIPPAECIASEPLDETGEFDPFSIPSGSWADLVEEEVEVIVNDRVETLPSLAPITPVALLPHQASELETHVELIPLRCFVRDLESHEVPHILLSRRLPDWINETDLRKTMQRLSTSKDKKYPLILINKKQHCVTVTFDPKTSDARYGLVMIKRLDVKRGNKSCNIGFSHAVK